MPSTSLPPPVIAQPEPAVAQPASISVPKQWHAPRAWKSGLVLIFVALLIFLVVGASFWSRVPSHPLAHSTTPLPTVTLSTSRPTPTSVSSIYPTLAGTYNGTIYDISVNVSSSLFLTSIQHSKENISGDLIIGSKLQGSGPFSGTIDTAGNLHFTVTDAVGHATLFFEGAMQSATVLSGDYYHCSQASSGQCSHGPGGYGLWSVVLAS
jgi:hypothetical protein